MTKNTSEQLIVFAKAIDIPLVYVMKLDTYGLLNPEEVVDWVVKYEFERIHGSGLNYEQSNREIHEHYGVSYPRIWKILRKFKLCNLPKKKNN